MIGLTPLGLDLDGGLASQRRLGARLHGVHDLSGFARSFRLRCRAATADHLRTRLAELRRVTPGPWLAFYGSGDFHHLSLLLLEALALARSPISLVLIDSHPDWFVLPPRYHCGNWVAGALRLQGVERVALIGTGDDDLRWWHCYSAPVRALAQDRFEIFPARRAGARLPGRWLRRPGEGGAVTPRWWGSELRWPTLAELGPGAVFSRVARALNGRDIYISIDKDSLRPTDASTDWGNGVLSLDDLTRGLRTLRAHCTIVGADVCGDRSPGPLRGALKRLDAGRLGFGWQPPTGAERRRNERANLAILRALAAHPRHPRHRRHHPEATAWTHSHGS